MKKYVISALLLASPAVLADTYVQGYQRGNGTYVQPYYRSDANSTTSDNYSTRGNTNPYTGSAGTHADTGSSYNINSGSSGYDSNSGSSHHSYRIGE